MKYFEVDLEGSIPAQAMHIVVVKMSLDCCSGRKCVRSMNVDSGGSSPVEFLLLRLDELCERLVVCACC
jgi:hypothetical protein